MSWRETLLGELAAGRAVRLRGSGPSMRGRIEDGDWVTLAPVPAEELRVGDVVLARVPSGRLFVHLIREIDGGRFLIGNMLGEIDGWVGAPDVLAKAVRIGDDADFTGVTLET
jgi:hypothetical protein